MKAGVNRDFVSNKKNRGTHWYGDAPFNDEQKRTSMRWKAPLLGGLMIASVAVLSSNIYSSRQHSHSLSTGGASTTLVSNESTLENRMERAPERCSTRCPYARESEEQTVNQIGSDPFNCIAYYIKRTFNGMDHLTGHYMGRCIEGISCACELGKEGLSWIKKRISVILGVAWTLIMGILGAMGLASGGGADPYRAWLNIQIDKESRREMKEKAMREKD